MTKRYASYQTVIYVIDSIIQNSPFVLAAPIAWLFRRNMSYTKTVDEHSIILENHNEKFDIICSKLEKTADNLGETNIQLAELTGILKEMHHHNS